MVIESELLYFRAAFAVGNQCDYKKEWIIIRVEFARSSLDKEETRPCEFFVWHMSVVLCMLFI